MPEVFLGCILPHAQYSIICNDLFDSMFPQNCIALNVTQKDQTVTCIFAKVIVHSEEVTALFYKVFWLSSIDTYT